MFRSLLVGLAVVACSSTVALADSPSYPLTIENCGRTLTFVEAPQKVVSLGQAMHEILYALDLGQRVAGTAVWLGPVKEEYAEVNAAVPRLAAAAPRSKSNAASLRGHGNAIARLD